jgi:hypothetical protein
MTTALIIAIILAVCIVYALGVYHGQHHGREQRKELAEQLGRTEAALDEMGAQYDRGVAARFRPALSAVPGAQVYDHAEEGL